MGRGGGGRINVGYSLRPPSHFLLATGLPCFTSPPFTASRFTSLRFTSPRFTTELSRWSDIFEYNVTYCSIASIGCVPMILH